MSTEKEGEEGGRSRPWRFIEQGDQIVLLSRQHSFATVLLLRNGMELEQVLIGKYVDLRLKKACNVDCLLAAGGSFNGLIVN